MLMGNCFDETQLPHHLRPSTNELLPFAPLDDEDGSEDEEDGLPSFQKQLTIYRASQKLAKINPLSIMRPATDSVFLEIDHLRQSKFVSEMMARQMLAMAYPTWHLLFSDNPCQSYALCFTDGREYVLCSDVLRDQYDRAQQIYHEDSPEAEEDNAYTRGIIAHMKEKFQSDEPSARLAVTPDNAHLLALKLTGERIRDGLMLTHSPSIRRGPLAGRAMAIVRVDSSLSNGSWKRLSVDKALSHRPFGGMEDCTTFVDWRYPREVICQFHGSFLSLNVIYGPFNRTTESAKSKWARNFRKVPQWCRKAWHRKVSDKRNMLVFVKGCEVCGDDTNMRAGTRWGQASTRVDQSRLTFPPSLCGGGGNAAATSGAEA